MAKKRIGKLVLEIVSKFEVLSSTGSLLFTAVLEDMEDDYIELAHSNGGDVPSVIYNTPVKLWGHLPGGVQKVTLSGIVVGNSATHWRVGDLAEFVFVDGRKAYRQSVMVPANVTPMRGYSFAGQPGTILNISEGGMLLNSKQEFDVGDNLFVSGVQLLPGSPPYSFMCRVLRVQENKEAGSYSYGCMFEAVSGQEQERLIHEIFILQRKSLRRATAN